MGNFKKAQESWAQLTRILIQEGANPRISGIFFNTVVHAVLILGSWTWVLTLRMGQNLGSFQQKFARRITGRHPRIREEGGWEYTPLEAEIKEAGFKEIGVYILKRQNIFA